MTTLTIALCVLQTAPRDDGGLVDRVAAVVNTEVILFSEIVSHLADQGRPLPGQGPEREQVLAQVLEELIDRQLISRAAFSTPFFEITDTEVEERVRTRREVQGEETFQARLEASGLSPAEYRQRVRERLAVNRFISLRFEPFVIVLPEEVDQRYQQLYGSFGDMAPPRADSEDGIRETLEQEKIQEQLQRWVQAERRKADIRILLFRDPSTGNRP